MRRVIWSIVYGIVIFLGIGFFQYKGQNPEWFQVASTAGFVTCMGYFFGYGDGKHDSY